LAGKKRMAITDFLRGFKADGEMRVEWYRVQRTEYRVQLTEYRVQLTEYRVQLPCGVTAHGYTLDW
jgi:hypothetical protein